MTARVSMSVDSVTVKTADLSADGVYRYALTRQWAREKPTVAFIMLNPSTADGLVDDPTIRRCLGFAHDWGFGTLRVVNLFALRATDPRELSIHADPIGVENARHVCRAVIESMQVVCAWGAHPMAAKSAIGPLIRRVAQEQGISLTCLGTTASGAPRHPLYLPNATATQRFLWPPA